MISQGSLILDGVENTARSFQLKHTSSFTDRRGWKISNNKWTP